MSWVRPKRSSPPSAMRAGSPPWYGRRLRSWNYPVIRIKPNHCTNRRRLGYAPCTAVPRAWRPPSSLSPTSRMSGSGNRRRRCGRRTRRSPLRPIIWWDASIAASLCALGQFREAQAGLEMLWPLCSRLNARLNVATLAWVSCRLGRPRRPACAVDRSPPEAWRAADGRRVSLQLWRLAHRPPAPAAHPAPLARRPFLPGPHGAQQEQRDPDPSDCPDPGPVTIPAAPHE